MASDFVIRAFGATDPGLHRATNEDRVYADAERGLYVVIDGVGGQAAGEVAAELALATLLEHLDPGPHELPAGDRLRAAIVAANNAIYAHSEAEPSLVGMACVLTATLVDGESITVGHVGDTRLYELRADGIRKITRDHALVGQMEDAGLLDEAEAMAHPRRNEILRDLGSVPLTDGAGFVDLYHLPFDAQSALLLCSDGLSDLVAAKRLHAVVASHAGRPDAAVRALLAAACTAGGYDNITALVLEGPAFAEAARRTRPALLPPSCPPGSMPHPSTNDPLSWAALQRRMQERRWLLAASAILLLGLLLVARAKTSGFGNAQQLLDAHAVANLNDAPSPDALADAFAVLYPDARDRRLAGAHTAATLQLLRDAAPVPGWTLSNVGRLNTSAFDVPTELAATGGTVFRARAALADPDGAVPLVAGTHALQRLKPYLVVRSPARYRWTLGLLAVLYFAAFYGLHAYWFTRRFGGDPMLLPIAHLLTGLAFVLMISLPDPLRDTFRAQGFVTGVLGGLALLAVVSRVDFQRAFWRRRPAVWLGSAVSIALVLFVFGTGPTGSEARVNLILPLLGSLQPVELVKLFLVLFMAGYFARYWEHLRQLHQRDGLPRWLQRLHLPRVPDVLPVAAGVLVALLAFFALRDMGPALVLGCTFLGLYGAARGRWVAVLAGAVLLVGGFWAMYETGLVPVVANRVEMMVSPWENFVVGGEHLAHASWAMAAGGVTGQGLGLGHPQYIPAAHTDLVLPALGEELGLAGLLAVLALYALLLTRSTRIALRAGGIFSLFLGLGVTLLLLFQIVLIAGGSLGLVPLSGVVSPFLSYGKTSMAANAVLLGVLASVSNRPKAPIQAETQTRHFRRPVVLLLGLGLGLLAAIAGKSLYVHAIAADAWTVKPALVVRADGKRAFTYNPRLFDARRHLVRGTIYDRNGVPLATSRPDELDLFADVYTTLGVDLDSLDPAGTRFYPFAASTFFLLGDVTTRVKWGATNSLYAEHAFLSHLRGFDNEPTPIDKRREREGAAEPVVQYNYAALLPLVRHGPGDAASKALIEKNRDVRLTVDIRLQQRVAHLLTDAFADTLTASAIVLDAATGEVLASVTHPLPAHAFTDPTTAHADPELFDRGFGSGAKPPGSTFKLVTAMAALASDTSAAAWTYPVRSWDRYARRGEPTGDVDMERAITASSNVYFAALAKELVGADTLQQMAEAFGFGIGLDARTAPDQQALLREPDNLRQAGFGQGPVVGSPLEVALVAATIANDGRRPSVRWTRSNDASREAPQLIPPRHARTLAHFMRQVVAAPDGTGKRLSTSTVPIAGKTGTAEERQRIASGAWTTVNHAWFTGFAPYRVGVPAGTERRLAVAVLVENGGMGGQVAAPIAGAILEAAAELGIIAGEPPSTSSPQLAER